MGPQSRFGDKLLLIRVFRPHIWDCGAKRVKERGLSQTYWRRSAKYPYPSTPPPQYIYILYQVYTPLALFTPHFRGAPTCPTPVFARVPRAVAAAPLPPVPLPREGLQLLLQSLLATPPPPPPGERRENHRHTLSEINAHNKKTYFSGEDIDFSEPTTPPPQKKKTHTHRGMGV